MTWARKLRHELWGGVGVPGRVALVLFLLAAGAAAWLVLAPARAPPTGLALEPAAPSAAVTLTLPAADSPRRPGEAVAPPDGAISARGDTSTASPASAEATLDVPQAAPMPPLASVEVEPLAAPNEAVGEAPPAASDEAAGESPPIAVDRPANATPIVTAAPALDAAAVAPPDAGRTLFNDTVPAPVADPQPRQAAAGGGRAGEAWLAYARPFEAPQDRPRIAVVIIGLGMSQAATAAAIRLPGAVTLGFSSYARNLQEWIDKARAAGHEVLLDLPMEPVNYPQVNPGPHPLLTSLSSAENVDRLKWHLDRATGYVGVTHNMGSRFTASPDHLRPVLSALKVRGLLFLDSRTSTHSVAAQLASTIGLPRAINDLFLDDHASRPAVDRRLDEIERIARRTGHALAIGRAYPVTLERLGEWLPTLDGKKLAPAPVSAVVNKQPLP